MRTEDEIRERLKSITETKSKAYRSGDWHLGNELNARVSELEWVLDTKEKT